MSQRVVLKNVRLSFPKLFEATQFQQGQGKARYDASFLVVPGSDNDKAILAAIREECKTAFGAKADAKLKALQNDSGKFCYQDGNTKEYEGYEDHFFLSSHRNEEQGPPKVVDKDKTPLTPADGKPYAGCYVNASVDIWAQSGQYPGIRCTLIAVQFCADGDAFAGAPATDEDFEDLSDPDEDGDDDMGDLVG